MALIYQIHSRITDANGDAVNGGVRYVYAAGTTTPSTIYSDVTLLTTQTNPVTADSGGKLAQIFVPAGSYRIVDKVSTSGATLFDADNVVIEDQNGTKGSDVASASTVTLGAGQYFHITGSTGPITDIDFSSPQNGRWAVLEFDSTPTITHHATTLKLPGAANIVAAAGDTCMVIQDSGDNMRVAWYQRAAALAAVTAATTTEALTGTDSSKYITADALAALWEKGSDIASAATISIGEGGHFHVTGTTTITDIDFGTAKNGRAAILEFDGALTLTHNATTLKLPSAANITTAAGDTCLVVQDAGDNVRVAMYQRAAAYSVIEFIIDGGGATITTGVKGFLEIPFQCNINQATLLADQSGSIVVDIWKDTYANYPPTVADTITASAKPTLSTATKSQDSTLTGWTTAVTAGDILGFNVDSATTVTRVTLSLRVSKA